MCVRRSVRLQADLAGPANAGHYLLAACVLAGLLPTSLRAQVPTRADEYRVKAAILFNLAKFVDWPKDTFASATAPLVLCVLGPDPFGSVLDETLNGRLIGKRPLVPMRVMEVTQGCHMLFITGGERKRLPVIADQLCTTSVLTIGEDDAFTG